MSVREMLGAVRRCVRAAEGASRASASEKGIVSGSECISWSGEWKSEAGVPDLGSWEDARPDEPLLLQQALQREVVRKVNAQWRACVERI